MHYGDSGFVTLPHVPILFAWITSVACKLSSLLPLSNSFCVQQLEWYFNVESLITSFMFWNPSVTFLYP